MISVLQSFGVRGVDGVVVRVEVDVTEGQPVFDVVGLPNSTVLQARNRVTSALRNAGFRVPDGRITVNLAPADMKKAGSQFDLPILLGVLTASGQFAGDLTASAFIGELSLEGSVYPLTGVLPMALCAKYAGIKELYVPAANAAEACAAGDIRVYPVRDLGELLRHLSGQSPLTPAAPLPFEAMVRPLQPDFCDVKGQVVAKRALEVAAAGGHNLLMIGPPGTGKSMLAKRLPSILPDLTFEESIEVSRVHSVAGLLNEDTPLVRVRPFRDPHHGVSMAGMVGGGIPIRPGEISLAHNGVLFLDEFPEYRRDVKEALRQPMENSRVSLSRAYGTLDFPADFQLVVAMNPCPCGYYGHPTRACTCSKQQASQYLSKVSGPMLDRIDIQVEVGPVSMETLMSKTPVESSDVIRARVTKAREIQRERYKGLGFSLNARITPAMLQKSCPLTDKANAMLKLAFEKLNLNPRSYTRILQVARTVADLAGEEEISANAVAETMQYRALERKYWDR